MSVARPRSARAQLALAAAVGAALAILLSSFPPQRYAFYPSCPVHAWLGLQCPGCGLTRALADLLAGHLRQAARQNALAVAALPVATGFALWQSYSVVRWNCWRDVPYQRHWVTVAYASMAIFGLTRNL